MTTLREMAEKVLATARLQRCSSGYSENTGEYEAGSCEALATHRITSPHEDEHWDYCENCARENHAEIPHNHRWSLWTIPGLEGVIAARELAKAVVETGEGQTSQDMAPRADAVLALSERLQSLEVALKDTHPKCSTCRAIATRSYYHIAGHLCYVCDNDKCMDEDFCDECGQVWYNSGIKCNATKDGGIPCTGTSKHPENHASHIRDLPHAALIRSLP